MKRIIVGLLCLCVLIASVAQAATVTVNPANLTSGSPCSPGFCTYAYTNPVWFFYNDETDVLDNSLGSFVTGPGTPLSGTGSAQISVSGTQRRNLATYQFKGTALSALTTLSYTTYNPSAGNGGSASRSAYLQFNVDFNASDTFQRRLLFLPVDNGGVVQNSWKTWDCLNGGNALWRYSGATWPAPISVSGTIPQTWNAILAAYPLVRFRLTDSWLGMRVGEPYADGYTENIDNFTLGTASGETTFDFEPGPASNVIAPVGPAVCITPFNPCVTVPMNIARTDALGVRAYTVTFQLSSNLALCTGSTSADVLQGAYLTGSTNYQVVDNGGGSYTVDCAILGPTAGVTAASGTLFSLNLKNVGGDGTGTVTVTNVGLRNPLNVAIAAGPGAPASVSIDNTAPTAVSGLAAAQQLTGNPAGPTTNINLSWSPVEAGSTVQLYRRGFGNYPEYNDAPNAGAVPPAPGTYPPAGWALVATLPAVTMTYTDFVETKSFNFEAPGYTLGNINAQNGWSRTGSFDHVVGGSYGWATFGAQSLRISDAITSGSFGDQTFASPLVNAAGETSATAGAFSVGVRKPQFDVQFDLASVLPAIQQPGLHFSMSPDRGDGSRMSYLRFEDNAGGIDVFFDDVQGTTNPANFVETLVATLSRTAPHRIRLAMRFVDGPSNDVVQVYIDGALVHTGTSWENYYRYDSEAAAEQSTRITKTVIFRTSGTATPANAGNGFLVDNMSLSSGNRDFWYYTAYVTDACGNHSAAAPMTSGTLNYHLGDVSNGITAGTGNNLVNTADLSLLGAHYGITLAPLSPYNYLDVGPTTDFSVNARPTTDNKVGFEDLMMFAINYTVVSTPQDRPALIASGMNSIEVSAASKSVAALGETFVVPVRMTGAGNVLGASIALDYDHSVVEFVSAEAGELLGAQGRPSVVLSPSAGVVDFALLGEGSGVAGDGVLASVTFRRIASGDAVVGVRSVTARDAANQSIALAGSKSSVPAMAMLGSAYPNPFRGSTSMQLSIARDGHARIAVYDLVGRRVRTLVDAPLAAGRQTLVWDGRDDGGRAVAAGLYMVRFDTPGAQQSRRLVLMP